MIQVALLRGVNVGGKNKVDMKRLKTSFEGVGLGDVRTYINSGNVIFTTGRRSHRGLAKELERAVEDDFGVRTRILLRGVDAFGAVIDAIPATWADDARMRCYVLFLWDDVDDPAIIDRLPIREGIDEVRYVPGAVIWRVDRPNVTRSGMARIAGTDLYQAITMRNCNTVRKLHHLMSGR